MTIRLDMNTSDAHQVCLGVGAWVDNAQECKFAPTPEMSASEVRQIKGSGFQFLRYDVATVRKNYFEETV